MRKSLLSVSIVSALVSPIAMAGNAITYNPVITTTSATKTETKAYAGLNWSLSGGITPSLVLGVAQASVKSDGDTQGGDLSLDISFLGGIKPGKLKLSYLNGKETVQGELGVGYNFLTAAPLLGLGFNAPYSNLGLDLYKGGSFDPYITIDTQSKFKKPTPTTTEQCVPVNGAGGAYLNGACTITNNPG
ncbi:MAG: hypothetical protein ACLPXB_03305 [Thiobacillaceae bacterium]